MRFLAFMAFSQSLNSSNSKWPKMNLLQKRQWTGICRFSPYCFCHIYMCSLKTKMENINFEENSGLGLVRKCKSENSLMERQCVSVQGKRTKHRHSVRLAIQFFANQKEVPASSRSHSSESGCSLPSVQSVLLPGPLPGTPVQGPAPHLCMVILS